MRDAFARTFASWAGFLRRKETPVAKQIIAPVIRVAPLGELKIYPITESELDELERGSPASIHLNFSLFFWGISASLLATLLTTTIASNRAFIVFVVFFCGSLLAAIVFTVLWFVQHRSSGSLARRIRGRMPPPPGVQEPAPNEPGLTTTLPSE